MRQSAWLAAVPERAAHEKRTNESRLERLRKQYADDDFAPDMPPLSGAAHVVGYLYELGPIVAAGMGAAPVSHLEIAAWVRLTGIELHPWEVRFLRRLSGEYLAELHAAEKADRPAPWGAVRAQYVARSMREQIAALAKL